MRFLWMTAALKWLGRLAVKEDEPATEVGAKDERAHHRCR